MFVYGFKIKINKNKTNIFQFGLNKFFNEFVFKKK